MFFDQLRLKITLPITRRVQLKLAVFSTQYLSSDAITAVI